MSAGVIGVAVAGVFFLVVGLATGEDLAFGFGLGLITGAVVVPDRRARPYPEEMDR